MFHTRQRVGGGQYRRLFPADSMVSGAHGLGNPGQFPNREATPEDKPFRLPVQGVYKFTKGGDTRRIVAGTVVSGKLNVGAEVIFYPSGKKSRVASLENFNGPMLQEIEAG